MDVSSPAGPWSVKTGINGMWREVAIVDATASQIATLAKYMRSLGDDCHADAMTETQAQLARQRWEGERIRQAEAE